MHKCPNCAEPVSYWRAFRTSVGALCQCAKCGTRYFLSGALLSLLAAFMGLAAGFATAEYFRSFGWFYFCTAAAAMLILLAATRMPLLPASRQRHESVKYYLVVGIPIVAWLLARYLPWPGA